MKGEVDDQWLIDYFASRGRIAPSSEQRAAVAEYRAAVRAAAIRECAALFISGLPGSFVRECRDRILALLDQPKEAGDG